MLPEINKTYDYFDDGKIRESRRLPVTITNVIPFNEIDKETLNDWEEDVEKCSWLYSKETDYFIKGDLKITEDEIEKVVFVRTINNSNGWFSLGWWGGRLDIDGTLNDWLEETIKTQ